VRPSSEEENAGDGFSIISLRALEEGNLRV